MIVKEDLEALVIRKSGVFTFVASK